MSIEQFEEVLTNKFFADVKATGVSLLRVYFRKKPPYGLPKEFADYVMIYGMMPVITHVDKMGIFFRDNNISYTISHCEPVRGDADYIMVDVDMKELQDLAHLHSLAK